MKLLHPFFNEEKFFCGAGFGGDFEDSMHFEASDELVSSGNAMACLTNNTRQSLTFVVWKTVRSANPTILSVRVAFSGPI